MSGFIILFIISLISFTVHNIKVLKTISIIGLLASIIFSTLNYSVPLVGFELTSSIILFEVVLFIVIIATILSLDESIAITQTLFLTTASILLLESSTILTFVLSFEAISIISFVMVSFMRNKKEAMGAIKMFIAGSLSTAIIVLGTALYLIDGHSLLEPISSTLTNFGIFGIWLLLLGVFYKLTIVPMHTWAADSYAQIRPYYAGILSGVAKTVVVVATFKIFSPFILNTFALSSFILLTLAVITMTLGNFLALYSKKVEKILSYSSIAHAGYMLLAFASVKSQYAATGLLYIAIAYIFMQTAVFLLLDKLSNGKGDTFLEDLQGLGKTDKLSSLFLTIQLFSLAGIPLLAGFMGKAILVYSVVDAGFTYVALVALLNSALSVGYYAWIIKHIYFSDTKTNKLAKVTTVVYISQTILLLGTLYFGIFSFTIFL